MSRQRDPLARLALVVDACIVLFVAVVVGGALLTVVYDKASLGAIGDTEVCVRYDVAAFTGVLDPLPKNAEPLAPFYEAHPAPSSTTVGLGFQTCVREATATMRVLAGAGTVLDLGFVAILLALLWRLVRTARRHGPLTLVVARQVSVLGWVLLLGTLAVGAVKAILDGVLVHLVVGAPTNPAIQQAVHLSPVLLVIAFGLLTLGLAIPRALQARSQAGAPL